MPRSKGLRVSISVREMPEIQASMRHEMAQALLEFAESERDIKVAARLREIAALFEIGQTMRNAK